MVSEEGRRLISFLGYFGGFWRPPFSFLVFFFKLGYLEAGYQLISLDDCWLDKKRGPDGRLRPDAARFPGGIRALSDYVSRGGCARVMERTLWNSSLVFLLVRQMHARGLRFGIYEDYGNYTCAGYPGVLNHMELDAQTMAEWQVDYVKLDGCYAYPSHMDRGRLFARRRFYRVLLGLT